MSLPKRLPPWLRRPSRSAPEIHHTKSLMRRLHLHSVCEEARCPNVAECFQKGTATFMILGNICTRNCSFCGCQKGTPKALDHNEPMNVALAAKELSLRHCVVTSVTRDDLPDGGASQFKETIDAIRTTTPEMTIEVLTPDFNGDIESLKTVIYARPDVFNHNIETAPRLYPRIRPKADYRTSLRLLAAAKEIEPEIITKSGLMLGLSETLPEIESVLTDLASANVDAVTIGQYMRPSLENVAVSAYLEPSFYQRLAGIGEAIGIKYIMAGPLVRSSYNAVELVDRITADGGSRRG
ncbi:lipoyl synthase [bacterium]|nr:lipoyl synthase [bacterium]